MQGEQAGEPVGPDVWQVCRELIPAGSVFAFLAEHREALFPAGMFEDMYPSPNGRPSLPPQVLAATVVLQALHGLSDFETAQQVRCDLRWKAACGLGLLDLGFDPSLLTYFRRRLGRSEDPNRLFAKVGQVVAATGVLAGKHRRALDSTVLDDAVATQDTVTQLIAAVRRVIREVPGAGEVAARWCTAHDYGDPGKPKIAWDDEQARAALVSALVTDALSLLEHLPKQRLSEQAANAAGLLALVAGQDVEPAEGSDGSDGRWRIAKRTVKDRVVSTVDPQARHIHKNRTRHQDGFKGHVSFEPEIGLFTAVALTGGSGAANHEAAVAPGLLAGEGEELTVLGDTAYGTGELRAQLQASGHTPVIKPPPLRPAIPGGFTISDFTIDDQAGTATCPTGHTAALGRRHADGTRQAQFKAACRGCPLRQRCTTSKTGRVLSVHPQHALLAAARQDATDPAWQAEYRRWRPPVERAIAWLVAHGNRRVPYRGITKNNTWLHHRAAALNLRHEDANRRTVAALRRMDGIADPVNFDTVARQAGVSRSWLYTQPAIRAEIERLRARRSPAPASPVPERQRISDASLRSRLAEANARVRQLQQENQQLRTALAEALGANRDRARRQGGRDTPARQGISQAIEPRSQDASTTVSATQSTWSKP